MTEVYGDFQICISVPLKCLENLSLISSILAYVKKIEAQAKN